MKFNLPVSPRGICLGIGLFFAVVPQGVHAGFFRSENPPPASSNFLETSSHHKTKHGRLSRRDKEGKATAEASEASITEVKKTPQSKAVINEGLVHLVKEVPSAAAVDQVIDTTYLVAAKSDLAEVTLTDTIPPDMEYVSSEPEAQVTGDTLKWVFPLKDGKTKSINVKLKAKGTGEHGSCATITAIPEACTTTLIGKPVLTLVKSGPANPIVLGTPVDFNIVVKNEGNSPAEQVVVTDTIPAGLAHSSGEKQLKFDLASLEPGATKTFNVKLNTTARGKPCNTARVDAANADSAKDDVCILVVQPGLKVTKEGPEKTLIGKTATYNIVVENVGDIDLQNVTVVDKLPSQATIVSASGAQVQGNTATWTIPSLPAAAKKNFSLVGKGTQLGKYCNEVAAKAPANNIESSDNACTTWTGLPALLLEVIDTNDPLLVGEQTTYIIKVTNQGTAPDTNIGLTVNLPSQISQVSLSGASQTKAKSQKSITFAPYPVLKPKETIEYRVVAKGAKEGDARLEVMLTSDLLKTPVPEVEATQVY